MPSAGCSKISTWLYLISYIETFSLSSFVLGSVSARFKLIKAHHTFLNWENPTKSLTIVNQLINIRLQGLQGFHQKQLQQQCYHIINENFSNNSNKWNSFQVFRQRTLDETRECRNPQRAENLEQRKEAPPSSESHHLQKISSCRWRWRP